MKKLLTIFTIFPVASSFPSQFTRCRGRRPSARNAIRHGTVCAVLACLALASTALAAEESIAVVEWKDAATGPVLDTNFATGIMTWSAARVEVVGAETVPPSPLPNEQALFVTDDETSDNKPRFLLEALPFSSGDSPAEGWAEFQLTVAGGFRLKFGAGGTKGMILSKETPYDGQVVMHFLIPTAGPAIYYNDPNDNKATVSFAMNVPENFPFILRVLWNVSPETITFNFQLDGVGVNDSNGMPVSISVPNTGSATAIEYISLVGMDLFIGKITAGRGTGPM